MKYLSKVLINSDTITGFLTKYIFEQFLEYFSTTYICCPEEKSESRPSDEQLLGHIADKLACSLLDHLWAAFGRLWAPFWSTVGFFWIIFGPLLDHFWGTSVAKIMIPRIIEPVGINTSQHRSQLPTSFPKL